MAVGMLLSTVSGVAPAASSQRDWTTNTARAKATSAAFCLMSPSQCPLLAAAETLHKRWESQGHVVLDPMVFFGPEVRFTFVSSKFTFLCFFLRTYTFVFGPCVRGRKRFVREVCSLLLCRSSAGCLCLRAWLPKASWTEDWYCSPLPASTSHGLRAAIAYVFQQGSLSLPGRSKEACLDRAGSRTWSSSGEHAEDKTADPHILRHRT